MIGSLGGSALAQVYGQIGNDAADFDSKRLARAFNVVQVCCEKIKSKTRQCREKLESDSKLHRVSFVGLVGPQAFAGGPRSLRWRSYSLRSGNGE